MHHCSFSPHDTTKTQLRHPDVISIFNFQQLLVGKLIHIMETLTKQPAMNDPSPTKAGFPVDKSTQWTTWKSHAKSGAKSVKEDLHLPNKTDTP